ncbi:MAG: type II toxin-antitoxin system HicA family toxin [Phycisphaeraceae bacterium]|nr:type II toxin-antitoxin system HicA family toxin [Phycisphaeraceae bacterium]
MPKLPRPAGAEMVRFLERQGFAVIRVRGSHHFMSDGTRRTTVPVHGRQLLKIGTLRSILRDVDLSPTRFEQLWQD